MAYETIIYEKKNRIAYVTLNRPQRGNSFNSVLCQEQAEVFEDIKNDDNIWGIILTGAGDRFFSTGIDQREAADSPEFRARGVNPANFADRPDGLWKPYIVAINGMCCGGGVHYIWQSDIAIAAEHATFFDPHVTRGWVPVREMLGMATRMPFGVAMRMAIMGTSERIDAKRALELGLVTELVPYERLIPRATEIMEQILEQSPLAVRAIIETMHRGMGLEYHYRMEKEMGELIRQPTQNTEDRKEGSRAFAEKRKPVWKAR
ncbi:MAG: enoyl-CoA hydratase/isomerase family protein [Chloroflexi bacterium]|nr:enoyl-CoA hydratase/isomerase family protein [Chloroflexota bacterium]